jgi:hypothetical protein
MDFLEELMRECILLGDSREGLADEAIGRPSFDDVATHTYSPIEKQTIPSTHPILSVLLFPDALAKLRLTVDDVKRFYEYLKNLETSGENGVMSKNALLDTVDGSGVNLEALGSLLAHVSKQVEVSNGERLLVRLHYWKAQVYAATDLRRSLVACSPVPRLCPLLIGITQAVSKSAAINKSRLFIKVVDFVSEAGKGRKSYIGEGQDVISKGILLRRRPTRVCVRCGSKTQQHDMGTHGDGPAYGSTSLQWQAWVRRWSTRCICGGRWVVLN